MVRVLAAMVRLVLALLLLTLWTLAGRAEAQEERSTVRLDGRAVLRVAPGDGVDAEDRAERVERRLHALADAPGRLAAARVERTAAGEPLITVGGVAVVTVSAADAEANLTPRDVLAGQWARALSAELQAARERRQGRAGAVGAGIEGALRAALSRLAEAVGNVVPRVLAALIVLLVAWLLASAVRRVLRALFRRVIADRTVENLIRQVVYTAVWVLGFVVAVDALGFRPQTVVAGLGLTGLALGFALKDIISNFVSGLLLLALRPFKIGDEITVGDTEGRVERIELRATQIRTYDGRLVLVPNAEIFTSRVTNNTASPVRRGSVECFVGYGDDLRRAAEAIRRGASAASGVLSDPAPSVRVRELGAGDIRLEVRFWADSTRSDLVATTHAVRLGVLDQLRAAHIALPDPALRRVEGAGDAAASRRACTE
jgi:small-conductance mechanosensitive channel